MKKILPFCILAIGLGFAQEPMGDSNPPAPASGSVPIGAPSVFDAVRGHGYNRYGTTGAPSSVTDLVLTPSDIYGKRFFYVSPSDELGYAAFNLFGGSGLLGLSSDPSDNLTLGFATPGFGIALKYTIRKTWREESVDYPGQPGPNGSTIPGGTQITNTRTTYEGDNLGLFFSLPLGSSTAYANLTWYTYGNSGITEVEGAPVVPGQPDNTNGFVKVDYSDINANLGMFGALGALNYDASLNIERHGGTLTSDRADFSSMGDKAVTEDSYLATRLNVNVSYAALKNEMSRIYVGSNNQFGIEFRDEVDPDGNGYAGDNVIRLSLTPNILGEVILADHWSTFAGAKHEIHFAFGDADRSEKTSRTSINQSATEAYLGIRYSKTNWAIETQFVNDDPFAAFGGRNILLQFGGFIYF